MQRGKLLQVIEVLVLVVLIGVTVHAPLTVFLGTVWPSVAIELKAWKELVLLAAGVLLLFLIHTRRQWRPLLSDRIIQLSLALIVLHILLIPLHYAGLLPTVAGLMIDLRLIAILLICYVLVQLDPAFMSRLIKLVAIGAAIIVGFGLLQLTVLPDDALRTIGYNKETIRPFTTIDRNSDFIRIQSTMRGPNPLGAMMIIYLSLFATWAMRYRLAHSARRWLGIIAAFLAMVVVLLASFSRSAVAGAAIALGSIAAYHIKPSKTVAAVGLGAVLLVGAGGYVFQSTDFYSNVVLHEDPESTVQKKSNAEHFRSLATASKRVVSEPLGAGIGSTGSASLYGDASGPTIENQYLFIAHEAGWFGLGLFVSLYGLILYHLWRRRSDWRGLGLFASGIGLAVVGLLLPVWVDDTVALTWWALAGVIIGTTYDKRTRQ